MKENKLPSSLYVHIPFCRHICRYCDFAKVFYARNWAEDYLGELKKEIISYDLRPQKTIYVGGGTPTALDDDLFEGLLSFLRPYLAAGGEFTMEGNPETITKEKADLMAGYGVNRFSLGVESANPRLLSLMGRKHTFDDVKRSLSLLREAGIENLSADLIYALPGETDEELEADIAALLSLKTPHLSTYCLSVNPMTEFYNEGVKEMEQDLAATQYELILAKLREGGYRRYEVSNFCFPGAFSRHNLVYWKDELYYGAGLGASGYLDGLRYTNTKNLASYLKGERIAEKEAVVPGSKSDLEYYFLTNLRLDEGFSLEDFEIRFGFSFEERYSKEVASLKEKGLALTKNGRYLATDKGILLLDQVLLALY